MGKTLMDLVEFTVACGRQGRTIASIGGYLTRKEQENIPEIYSRMSTGQTLLDDSPATAMITSKTGRKGRIPLREAVDWFIGRYPKWSLPLQTKMQEQRPPLTKTILAYGLKEGMEFSDKFYVEIIAKVANLPEEQAESFYRGVLKPQLQKLDELKGLIETEIKI
jgi:hypothetical protein